MTRADFAAQYNITDGEFPWLTRFKDACVDKFGKDQDLTLKQYLTAWTSVTTEAADRLGKKEK